MMTTERTEPTLEPTLEIEIKGEHFGSFLRSRRQARGLSLSDVSRATKIKESVLAAIESARLDLLPARVFVIGYLTAYARTVGLAPSDVSDVIERFRRFERERLAVRSRRTAADEPLAGAAIEQKTRRVGVVMVVFLILLVATLTLSYLLRHDPPSGRLSAKITRRSAV